MEIYLDRLKDGDNELSFTAEEVMELDFEDFEVTSVAPLTVNFTRAGEYLYLKGGNEISISRTCSRCADEFSGSYNVEMEFVFHEGEFSEEGGSDDLIKIDRDQKVLNIGEYYFQSIAYSLPFSSLCSEDCKGLCTKCGQNLNEKECECSKKKDIDPRWAKLAEIAEEMRKKDKDK